ncbi:MAG: TonB-dependent receptor [Comamonadaceae bacterium]|nr:MAG: TonB-dependent receptor [Comamonadaceae bacterium]
MPPLPSLPTVVVSTPQGGTPLFEVPGSVDRVDATQLRDSRLQVNLSESLGVVPGLQALDRQNYAQDLQISIRGFGARSTFGLRGIRLYVDGIPATLPDGQGQSSNIDLGSADRIEVLRGPFSALYGNASGGVIQVFTEDGQGAPRVEASMAGASFGGWRAGLKASGSTEPIDYVLSTSRFHTDGWREHSAATRDIANGKLGIALADDARLTLVANSVRIRAQDPLGLTLAQFVSAPRAAPLATQYETRKTVDQTQAGLVYDRPLGGGHALRLMAYGGERATTQFQSIPPAAQANPLQAGGVIDLSRRYAGFDARWLWRTSLAGGPFDLTAGLAHDSLQESRRGYENFVGGSASPLLGVQGRLRRNERNEVSNIDPYLQARWQFLPRWTVEAGLRHSSVRFESQDRYLMGRNGDDSGSARYRKALPVGSLRYAASDALSLYATAGRGFETPTLNELSYRSDGRAGLNFGLRPATNDSVEIGAKARLAGGLLTAAAFRTGTRDEIVTATNFDGRATFQNAGRTRREGFELGWQHETVGHWRTQLAYTWIDARYRDGFCAVPCASGAAVPEGHRIPGIAPQALFASFGYAPSEGFRAGVEVRARSDIRANDLGTAGAPGHAVLALQAAYALRWSRWTLDAFARIDNLLDRREIGSVIVNEGNGRYFEPAPGRNWTVGAQAAYRF